VKSQAFSAADPVAGPPSSIDPPTGAKCFRLPLIFDATTKPVAAEGVTAYHRVHHILTGMGEAVFCYVTLHARLFRLWHRFRADPGVRYIPVTREQLTGKQFTTTLALPSAPGKTDGGSRTEAGITAAELGDSRAASPVIGDIGGD
jgi:hypothetical protein